MWYEKQSDTRNHAFPCIVVTHTNLGQGEESCVKLTHVEKLFKHFHNYLLYPSCHMLPVSKRLFWFPKLLYVQNMVMQVNAWHLWKVYQMFFTKTSKLFTPHLSCPQFDCISRVRLKTLPQNFFCKGKTCILNTYENKPRPQHWEWKSFWQWRYVFAVMIKCNR